MVHVSGKSVAAVEVVTHVVGVEVVTHVPVESVPVDVLVVIEGSVDSMSSHRVLGGTVIHPFQREAFLPLLW